MKPRAACGLCGSAETRILYGLPAGKIRRCGACNVVFRENLVAGTAAAELYEDDGYLEAPYFEALKVGSRQDVEPYLVYRRVLERLEAITPHRRLLDVGCAYGAFMEVAQLRGWDVAGVEISTKACTYARAQRGLDIFTGTLEEAAYPTGSFAVVSLWDVVEHLDAPLALIQEVHRILEPGGVLVVFTINQRSLINRAGDLLYRLTFRRLTRPLELLYDIHHNYFFDVQSLTGLLRAAGFSRPIQRDHLGAHIDRWQNVPIPPLLAWGSKALDLAAHLTGQQYRMILFAPK